jgi:hypothetical protein
MYHVQEICEATIIAVPRSKRLKSTPLNSSHRKSATLRKTSHPQPAVPTQVHCLFDNAGRNTSWQKHTSTLARNARQEPKGRSRCVVKKVCILPPTVH